jgi:transposase-like protein
MKSTRIKKSSARNKFIIASGGKNKTTPSATLLHINTADKNDSEAIEAHYKELINKGLVPQKIELVVTDMLAAYREVIKKMFPNALHQFCIFHVLQLVNGLFKDALKEHRHKYFKEGERKEAHKIALYMLKGQEKLTPEEKEKVLDFCEKHPNVMANYAFKEDFRALYALSQTEIQAIAYRDIIVENYQDKISDTMQKALTFLTENFEYTISYLKVQMLHAKTNNDAERIMRKIERNQEIHYVFRKEDSLIRHLKTRLGLNIPITI